MNKTIYYSLLVALFLIPAAATIVHMNVHSKITWLPWVTIFDAIVITILLARKSTAEYGFYLNSVLALSGLYHFLMKPELGIIGMFMAGLSDVMFVAVDFLIGFAIYKLATQEYSEPKPTM